MHDLCFSPDGRWLASSGRDWTVRLWDYRAISQGAPAKEEAVLGSVPESKSGFLVTADFSPDSSTLAIGDSTGKVTLWDPDRQGEEQSFHCHDQGVTMLAFGPDGKTLTTVSRDHTARLWELGGRKEVFTGHEGAAASVCVTRDGDQWISGGDEWLVLNGRQVAQPQQAIGFETSRRFGHMGSSEATHVGILQQARASEIAQETLLSAYLRARNLKAALTLLTTSTDASFRDQTFRDVANGLVHAKRRTAMVPDVVAWHLRQLEALAETEGNEDWKEIVRLTQVELDSENAPEGDSRSPRPSLTGRWINSYGGYRLHIDQQGENLNVRHVHTEHQWTGRVEGDRITLTVKSGDYYMAGTFTGTLTNQGTAIRWDNHEDHWRFLRPE